MLTHSADLTKLKYPQLMISDLLLEKEQSLLIRSYELIWEIYYNVRLDGILEHEAVELSRQMELQLRYLHDFISEDIGKQAFLFELTEEDVLEKRSLRSYELLNESSKVKIE